MMPNNLQTNTFTGGLDLDSDIIYLKDSQYRNAKNVRVVTNDKGTNGSLQNIDYIKEVSNELSPYDKVVATATENEVAVILTKFSINGKYQYNSIYTLILQDDDTLKTNLVLKAKLDIDTEVRSTESVKLIINYESENNIKVYIADSKHMIRVINLTSDEYKETDPQNPLLDENGLVKDITAFDIIPGATLPNMELIRMEEGSLNVGMVQYCYQLFNVRGSETEISSLSSMIHLTSSDTTSAIKDYEGDNKDASSKKACVMRAKLLSKHYEKCRIIRIFYEENNSVPKIDIVDEININKDSDYIQYIDTGNTKLGELTVEELNARTGSLFSAATIAKMNNRLFAANIKEDSWNPTYDARAYRCNSSKVLELKSSSGLDDIQKSLNGMTQQQIDEYLATIPEKHDCINPYNTSDSILDRYNMNVMTSKPGGYGVNVSYNFIIACTTKSVQTGDMTVTQINRGFKLDNLPYNNTTVGIDLPAEEINGVAIADPYNSDGSTGYVDSIIKYISFEEGNRKCQPNYADPYLASKYKSHQRDEVYRYGIVLYNTRGVASPVKWIGDIRMPYPYDIPFMPIWNESEKIYARPLGIQFTVKNLPEDCIGYEIVRCDRTQSDRTVVGQTAVAVVGNHSVADTSRGLIGGNTDIRPHSLLTYGKQGMYSYRVGLSSDPYASMYNSDIRTDAFRLVSPEISIMGDKMEDIIGKDCRLVPLYGLCSPMGIYTYQGPSETVQYNKIASGAKTVQSTAEGTGRIQKDNYQFLGTVASKDTVNAIAVDSYNYENNALPSLISKYYIPFLRNVGSTPIPASNSVAISQVIYPKQIPFNIDEINLPSYYTSIAGYSYINLAETDFHTERPYSDRPYQKEGPHGPCLIANVVDFTVEVKLINEVSEIILDGKYIDGGLPSYYNKYLALNSILIANIKRYSNQYGGNSYSARQNSVYITTGESHLNTEDTAYVFGGDTYICLLDYPIQHIFQYKNRTDNDTNKLFTGAYIPFETTINLNLTNGHEVHRTYTDSTSQYIDIFAQAEPGQMSDYHSQSKPYYAFNDAYSSRPTAKSFIPSSQYSVDDKQMSNRIVYSEPKVNDEVIDNWTNFKVANYLDVDNQYGSITNMKVFKDRLFFWQEQSLGIAAVNERSLINDGNVGALTLGTGDILSRYDYLTTTNGNSTINDRSIVSSDNVLYWYDSKKKELCSYNGQVNILSKEKNVQSFFNDEWKSAGGIWNSLFDKKYNEVWFIGGNSLIFNEQLGRFTSFYTFTPDYTLNYSDRIIGFYELYNTRTWQINAVKPGKEEEATYPFGTDTSWVQFVVNKDPAYTKVFDNVLLSGNFTWGDKNQRDSFNSIMYNTYYETKHQHATPFSDADYREDTFRFAIGRADNTVNKNERMRGKYLSCMYGFNTNTYNSSFQIPYINTTYRYSLV